MGGFLLGGGGGVLTFNQWISVHRQGYTVPYLYGSSCQVFFCIM